MALVEGFIFPACHQVIGVGIGQILRESIIDTARQFARRRHFRHHSINKGLPVLRMNVVVSADNNIASQEPVMSALENSGLPVC